jgi:tetratricopeptide (TPR) repeat protein
MMLLRFLLLGVLLRLYPVLLAEMREQRMGSDGLSEEARREIARIAREPENVDTYARLGAIYLQAKQPEKAIEAFRTMASIDPSCQRAFVSLARVRNSQQRFAEAEQAARHAVDLRKLDLRARFELGVSLAGQRRNLEEATENLRMAAAEIPEAHLELSRLFLERGNFELAMRELQAFRKTGRLGETAPGQLLAK